MKKLINYGFKTSNLYYTIAEIGINHGGNIDLAKKLIDSAAKTGVDSVKFQTYITEKRAPADSPIFDILKQCELPFEAFHELKLHADSNGVDFFSTPFDNESVQCLEDIGVNLYKVASFDVVNNKLLKRLSSNEGKAIIMSVGMATLEEIKNAYKILIENTDKITILHCVSSYPTKDSDANLETIRTLKQEFDCVIGQSDHTDDIEVPMFAAARGAQVLEKHYKIDDDMDCVDSPVSITENQMTTLINKLRYLEEILGDGTLALLDAEKGSQQFRRPT